MSGALFPDHGQMDDGLHGLFHVLHADPFRARVNGVLAGEDVGAGQPHKRQPRPVSATADRVFHGLEAGARIASMALSMISGWRSITCFMLRYCCAISSRYLECG